MTIIPHFRRSTHAMQRMYNRIYRIYNIITKGLGPKLDAALQKRVSDFPDPKEATALEYACGTGTLSVLLATHFKSVTSRDLSVNMLSLAKKRAIENRVDVSFMEGNLLDINDGSKTYDYVFISFALHLFAPEAEVEILKSLCRVARKAVVIIDHGKKWNIPTAILEWIEGGYFDMFIKTDFNTIAKLIGCSSYEEEQREDGQIAVMTFYV